MILEPFYPKEWLDSTYEIDWEQWKRKGIRGVLFDIDNTLVPHGAPADSRAIALFEKLHALGFQTCLLSNNKELRVKSFADQVHSPYIYKAGKPGVKNYNRTGNGTLQGRGPVCGRPAIYRRVRGEPGRDLWNPGKADQPEGRDPDRVKTVPGSGCALFLQEAQQVRSED